MKTSTFPEKQNNRRFNVIARLEQQLKDGTKREKITNTDVPLTSDDRKRIERELVALNKALVPGARERKTKKYRGGMRRS